MNNWSLIKSRTFWTAVATFIVVGGNSVVGILPSAYQDVAVAILGFLTVYFHINPSTTYNLPKDGSSVLS